MTLDIAQSMRDEQLFEELAKAILEARDQQREDPTCGG